MNTSNFCLINKPECIGLLVAWEGGSFFKKQITASAYEENPSLSGRWLAAAPAHPGIVTIRMIKALP